LTAINFTAVIDTREQNPVSLRLKDGLGIPSRAGTLATGDYSIAGLEPIVAIERKSLDDLMACIGTQRERFDREIQRLLGYQTRAIVVESTWDDIENGRYRSRVKPAAAVGSLLGWIAKGVPIIMAGNHDRAGVFIARLLYISARRTFHQLKALGAAKNDAAG